ncbi:MAG TPA: hypothetical protein VKV35_01340 [Streptosporangiaceae bacterium]|nr:hypothetical protein [Streptosporangiaceae bacterium]
MAAAELRRARLALLGYFFVLGAATATWSARLPAITATLHLSDGRLGLAAVAGFALLGAGLACIFPQIVSAAARLEPARAGRNIGRIAAVAYTGLLGGPVAIGALASGVGLRHALLLPAALALLVAAVAAVMAPRHGCAASGAAGQPAACRRR